MIAELQACSLEQGIKLKELGITQESYFCYIGDSNPDPRYNLPHEFYSSQEAYREVGASWYHARVAVFTVTELFMIIPSSFYMGTDYFEWQCHKADEEGRVDVIVYKNGDQEKFLNAEGKGIIASNRLLKSFKCFGYESFAKSLAELLIWLIQKRYVDVNFINQKFKAHDRPGVH